MKSVSVVIPTFKNRGGLVNSIESVLSQNYKGRLEVIVVDDNDPSSLYRRSTKALMSTFKNDPRVKYICHESNKNGAAARNTGIHNSSGEYIAFLDDDDVFLKDKITRQVDYLENNPNVDAVYCYARRGKKFVYNMTIEGNGLRQILMLQSNFFTSTLMFRREAIESIHGFDENFIRYQDYELLLRFFSAGYKIGCVQEILVELGSNQGENIPKGYKLNKIKALFFEKFNQFILEEDKKTPGFARKVYAKHYAGVFLNHMKHKHFIMAGRVFFSYFLKSPRVFCDVLLRSLKLHIK
jgi:glycosyltransferase involved in cell wall biosynthesis